MELNRFEAVKMFMEKYHHYLRYSWGIQSKVYFIGIILTLLCLGFSYLAYVLPEAIVTLSMFIFVSGVLALACFVLKKELFVTRNKLLLKCRNLFGNKLIEYETNQFTRIVVTVEAAHYTTLNTTQSRPNLIYVFLIGKENVDDFDLTEYVKFSGLNAKAASFKVRFAEDIASKTKLKLTLDDNLYEYVPNFVKPI